MSDILTLGQYFRQLREKVQKWPDIDLAKLERMSVEEIRAECNRRRWSAPGHFQRCVNHERWVEHFLTRQDKQQPVALQWIADRPASTESRLEGRA